MDKVYKKLNTPVECTDLNPFNLRLLVFESILRFILICKFTMLTSLKTSFSTGWKLDLSNMNFFQKYLNPRIAQHILLHCMGRIVWLSPAVLSPSVTAGRKCLQIWPPLGYYTEGTQIVLYILRYDNHCH